LTAPLSDDAAPSAAAASAGSDRTLRVYPTVDVKMRKRWQEMADREKERRKREGARSTPLEYTPPAPEEKWESHYWDVVVTEGPDYPFSVSVRVGSLPNGRLGCTGLILGDGTTEITSHGLREVKVPEIVSAAAKAYELHGGHADPGFAHFLLGYDIGDGIRRKPRVRPGRKGYGREHFEGQALPQLYARALETDPSRPARFVADRLEISEPTARRWIKRAEVLGLIGTGAAQPDGRRRCAHPDCDTILSRFNDGDRCALHGGTDNESEGKGRQHEDD
jgi:hypothetical protein